MPVSRRTFLQLSTFTTAAAFMPKFLNAFAAWPLQPPADGKILVVLQLSGGNDGLNTVVPVRNDLYYRSRPTLAIKAAEALPLTDELALNPTLSGLKRLYDRGRLAILNGVGYPRPDRSHYGSTEIWHSGGSVGGQPGTGWLGRYLDLYGGGPHAGIELGGALGLAMTGRQGRAMTMQHGDATLTAQLNAVSSHIRAGSGTTVYYVAQDGYDMHVAQRERHGRLLREMDEAITAFVADMEAAGRMGDVLIVTCSEFGRRVAENPYGGTDHGTASSMFVIGSELKQPGIYNPLPDLADLDEGDLKHSIDFRQVYATLLARWLGADAEAVLGQRYSPLPIL